MVSASSIGSAVPLASRHDSGIGISALGLAGRHRSSGAICQPARRWEEYPIQFVPDLFSIPAHNEILLRPTRTDRATNQQYHPWRWSIVSVILIHRRSALSVLIYSLKLSSTSSTVASKGRGDGGDDCFGVIGRNVVVEVFAMLVIIASEVFSSVIGTEVVLLNLFAIFIPFTFVGYVALVYLHYLLPSFWCHKKQQAANLGLLQLPIADGFIKRKLFSFISVWFVILIH